jgi:three-Cys-motif partner protein
VKAELICIFVESDPTRCDHLRQTLAQLAPSLPRFIKWEVVRGRFDEHLTKTFDLLDAQAKGIAPSFVFIDPFGFSHTPFRTVKRILGNKGCEVLVNFMYEEVNRFLSLGTLSDDMDELFGTEEWRDVQHLHDAEDRRRAIHDIYFRQLQTVAKYVDSFEMRNRSNSTDYFLFFATNNLKGLEKMKEAMWKVDGTGSFRFSDHYHARGLQSLFSEHPNVEPLREAILRTFGGSEVLIERLVDWVVSDTEFLPKHLKRPVLAPMEAAGEVSVVNPSAKRRKGTFSDGTILRFR